MQNQNISIQLTERARVVENMARDHQNWPTYCRTELFETARILRQASMVLSGDDEDVPEPCAKCGSRSTDCGCD